MVTSKKRQLNRPKTPAAREFYLRAWRKKLKVSPALLAAALKIERQSYHRLEKAWWTISAGEMATIAEVLEINPSQLWFPPPKDGEEKISLDEMVDEMPDETMQLAAIAAVRGIAGR